MLKHVCFKFWWNTQCLVAECNTIWQQGHIFLLLSFLCCAVLSNALHCSVWVCITRKCYLYGYISYRNITFTIYIRLMADITLRYMVSDCLRKCRCHIIVLSIIMYCRCHVQVSFSALLVEVCQLVISWPLQPFCNMSSSVIYWRSCVRLQHRLFHTSVCCQRYKKKWVRWTWICFHFMHPINSEYIQRF